MVFCKNYHVNLPLFKFVQSGEVQCLGHGKAKLLYYPIFLCRSVSVNFLEAHCNLFVNSVSESLIMGNMQLVVVYAGCACGMLFSDVFACIFMFFLMDLIV